MVATWTGDLSSTDGCVDITFSGVAGTPAGVNYTAASWPAGGTASPVSPVGLIPMCNLQPGLMYYFTVTASLAGYQSATSAPSATVVIP